MTKLELTLKSSQTLTPLRTLRFVFSIPQPRICQTILATTISSTLLFTGNPTLAQQNQTLTNQVLISLEFQRPKDAVPKTSVGGGVRGQVQFSLPGGSAPRTSVGGGTRGDVQFALPGGSAPRTSVGGGTRGDVQFALPGGSAPRTSVGGGTRGDVQFALPGGSAPRTSVGGGTRGDVQFALPGGSAPRTSVGGGTRGDVQFALPGGSAPRTSVGGGTRGDVQLALPSGGSAPRTSVGGGTRGDVQLALPSGGSAPRTSVGGGTRGDVQLALPSGGSAPRTSIGGGTRGEIPPLTALVPPTKHGRTVSAHPTIFAYLPPIGAEEVFFSLQDEEGNSHYYTILKVSADGGVISITLPPTAPALEIGKNYLWYFAPVEPGGILKPDNYAVTGWIKRVEKTFNEQELASSPVKLATKYAEAGVWYDTLKVLAAAKRSEPNNKSFATEWHDLLKQVGLEKITSQPLIEAL